MNRKWIALIAALLVLVIFTGCSGKKKEVVATPDPMPAAPEPTSEPAPTPAPEDPVERVQEPTLAEREASAREQGLLGDVFFEFDRADLTQEARSRLAKNAEFMKGTGQDLAFTIEGHCDERGTNEYNLALGDRRAQAAKDYLVSLGVENGRFRTISYGEERPFCTESSEGCWQQNRRAHFVLR